MSTRDRPHGGRIRGRDKEYDETFDDDMFEDDDDTFEDESDDAAGQDDARGGDAELPAHLAARSGLRYIAELTGKPATGVTSMERVEVGWLVGVAVVVDRRIPSSGDVLAVYETEIGRDGSLLGYRRTRRYARGRGDRGEEG
jgi:hypothetical protein